MSYIQPFGQINKKDSPVYGGKVASLGDIFQAGIPVPNGFGISIEAHKEFHGKQFSKEFSKELKKAFRKLRAKRVAVRSSAVAEDSSDASWAGQLETYLNVPHAELEKSIRKCWKSVETESVKAYAQDKRLKKGDLLVGVAVQAMVDSELSGVMFTANPVSNNQNESVIEGSYGLGEMVVQGLVSPDRYVVDNKKMTVVEYDIKVKDKMMVFKDEKNTVVDVPEEVSDRNILWEKEILELVRIGLEIENHYGKPQDIEWARVGSKFYITQARPITTLR